MARELPTTAGCLLKFRLEDGASNLSAKADSVVFNIEPQGEILKFPYAQCRNLLTVFDDLQDGMVAISAKASRLKDREQLEGPLPAEWQSFKKQMNSSPHRPEVALSSKFGLIIFVDVLQKDEYHYVEFSARFMSIDLSRNGNEKKSTPSAKQKEGSRALNFFATSFSPCSAGFAVYKSS